MKDKGDKNKQRETDLTEFEFASGLYGRGILGKLMSTHAMQAHTHSHTQSTNIFLLIVVGFPFISSPPLSIHLPSCCFHVFPFTVETNPVLQGKNIPHSKGKKAPPTPGVACSKMLKHKHAKHTCTIRQRKQAHRP